MTVRELIAKLQKYPQYMEVYYEHEHDNEKEVGYTYLRTPKEERRRVWQTKERAKSNGIMLA